MQGTGSRKKKIIRIGAAVLLIVALLFSIRISKVEVTGNEWYTKEQMEQILFPDSMSRITVFCFLQDRLKEHIKIPFVEDYDIVFQKPNQVEVIVYEKSVVGYVSYMNSYMYFDKDGALPGVPLITGLTFGQIVLHQKLPVERPEVFDEILNLTQILSIYDMQIDRIQYGNFGETTLYLKDLEVLLGNSGNLNGKISELNDMLPQLEGLKGVLHLEDYDEANIRSGYTLDPK